MIKGNRWDVIPYENSLARSRNRRNADKKKRRHRRLLALPAVLGSAWLIIWIKMDNPVDYWYLGLLGIAAVVPWLTLKIERMFDEFL